MFSVVIPVFNEEENLEPLTNELIKYLSGFNDYEIIFVNDSSYDNSLNILKKIVNNNNNYKIVILNNDSNKGQSYSILKGVREASFDIIVTIDGDGQNNPKDIYSVLNIYNSDKDIQLVGGIRNKRKDNIIKVLSSKIANSIRSFILKDNCVDTGCSLKAFNKNIFLKFPYFNGIHRFLPALFLGYGYKTKFVNVDHRKRKKGNSKYGTIDRLFIGIIDMYKVYKIIKKTQKKYL